MSWGPTEQWVQSEELYASLKTDHPALATLRRAVLNGEIGVVERCSDEQREQLDSVNEILGSMTLRAVNNEEVA